MKVRVKLYGILSQRFPGYRHSQGIEVEIPDRTTVKALLAHLKISESQGVAVAMEGRVLKADDIIRGEVPVHVLQSLSGG
jgi:sulfur carrier protein ThiS